VLRQPVQEQVRFRKVGGGIDAFQNFTETTALAPSSLMPERPETL
jgi:hypothetical protein